MNYAQMRESTSENTRKIFPPTEKLKTMMIQACHHTASLSPEMEKEMC